MIGVPFDNNDLDCLCTISEVMVALAERRDPLLLDIAQQHPTTTELAAWIRSLPQRDDFGTPGDGPKVEACQPVQRLRIPAPDPNCVERAALYLGVAELIDPHPLRQLGTLDFTWGRHTFPLENGAPIILDPRISGEEVARRVAAGEASITAIRSAKPQRSAPVVIDVREAIDYTARLAEEGTQALRNGPRLAWLARNAIHELIENGTPPRDEGTIDALGWFFAHAEAVARSYGLSALTIVRRTAQAISDLVDDVVARYQRNLSFDFNGSHYNVPDWAGDAASMLGKVALNLGAAYIRPYVMAAGVTHEMLGLVEQELNSEGYSLGPLSKPGQSFSSGIDAISNKKQQTGQ